MSCLQSLALKDGILKWLNISSEVSSKEMYGKPVLDLSDVAVDRTEASGHSRGLLLRMMHGSSQDFSVTNMLTASSFKDRAGLSLTFRGLIASSSSSATALRSQMSCSYCSGQRFMDWPSGTISEPGGMIASDVHCTFVCDGAQRLLPKSSKAEDFRGVVITVHALDFADGEYLEVESDVPGLRFSRLFQRGQRVPVTLHAIPIVFIRFKGKSHLHNQTGGSWFSTLRFKLSYQSVSLSADGFLCCSACDYHPDCIQKQGCFANAKNLTLEEDGIVGSRSLLPNADESPASMPVPETARRSLPSVDKLALVLQGEPGVEQRLPCALSQGPEEILTVVERERGDWRGAQATWEGDCYIRPSCLTQDYDCQEDALYFEDVNSCSVHVQFLDRMVREYRYDCEGGSGLEGFAHGILTRMSPTTVKIGSSNTGNTILAYREFEVKIFFLS